MFEVIDSLSKTRGVSRSRVITDILNPSYPILARIANVMETADQAQREFFKHSDSAVSAQAAIVDALMKAGVYLEEVQDGIQSDGPPICNTGVNNEK